MHGSRRWNNMLFIGSFIFLILGTRYVPQADAQEQVVLTSGKLEYQQYCTSCHGSDGKGKGSMADLLKKPPASLTILSKRNNGQFPFWRVYRTVDGREEVMAHGPRTMPIWGSRFLAQEGGSTLDEHTVLGRILALVYFIESIQEK